MFTTRNGLGNLKTYDVEDTAWPVKLDANEMPTQFEERIQAIVAAKMSSVPLNRYPQIAASSLRQILADGMGLNKENVLVGNGSSELLGALCFAFGGRGRRILFPTPSFSMYGVYASLSDSESVSFTLSKEFEPQVDQLAEKIKEIEPNLVILCNPNNPTGNSMHQNDIAYIAASANCPVVVDEAYYEFYGQTSLSLLDRCPNLIITRTFSKAYGLAAARVGYLVAGSDITGAVGKVLLPYHVNALSLAAAEAVYEKREQLMPAVLGIVAERDRLTSMLKNIGDIQVFPSETNFLLIKTRRAGELTATLGIQGIGVRDFSKYPGLEDCIRITVGTQLENNKVAEAIQGFFK